jgi:thiamine-phosphate pyrophosphorylase
MAPQQNNRSLTARPLLCLVSDRSRIARAEGSDGRAELVDLVRNAGRVGVDLIQVRERDLSARDLYELVRTCVQATLHSVTRLIVNDRLDVALAAGAAGIHLRSDSPDASRVRQVVPDGFLIGRSVHGSDEAVAAVKEGEVDYLIAGTIFPTASKSAMHDYLGLEGLRVVVQRVDVPVLAIGGVTMSVFGAIAACGAAGVAAIRLFADAGPDADELARFVQKARTEFDTSGRVS